MRFVTARGWEDLSNLMSVYEEMGLPVDEGIVAEFLHHPDIAEDAAAYFDLYRKYQRAFIGRHLTNGSLSRICCWTDCARCFIRRQPRVS